ncbi:MAG TPA: hypothetical protein VLJ16_12805 [Acidobacteriota bacterium]|nr:hypothetical protein [Acidobacteriota bacterium]
MPRRAVALGTMAVFILSSTGCMTWGTKEIRTTADYPGQNGGILSLVKRSGEVVEFSRMAPARIVGNQVVGTADVVLVRDVEIEGPFRLIKRLADGTATEVIDAKGRVWSIRSVLNEEPNKMTARVADHVAGSVAIPLSEIRQVKLKRINVPLTILAGLGFVAVTGVALLAYYINRD